MFARRLPRLEIAIASPAMPAADQTETITKSLLNPDLTFYARNENAPLDISAQYALRFYETKEVMEPMTDIALSSQSENSFMPADVQQTKRKAGRQFAK